MLNPSAVDPAGGDSGESASSRLRRRISQLLAEKLPIARTLVPSNRSRFPSRSMAVSPDRSTGAPP